MAPILTSLASIVKQYGITGLAAVAAPSPTGIVASGGIINDYEDSGTKYRAHIFTSSGAFEVTDLGDIETTVQILQVGGGGGGGEHNGAGGGAGGLQYNASASVSVTTYPIVIGAGGHGSGIAEPAGVSSPYAVGGNGGPTTSGGLVTEAQGGGGGAANAPENTAATN